MLRLIGVQNRRNVVLRVHGGKQHAGHGEHIGHPLVRQFGEPVLDHRGREFEKTVLDGDIPGPFADRDRQFFELGDSAFVAAATVALAVSLGLVSALVVVVVRRSRSPAKPTMAEVAHLVVHVDEI